MTTVNKYETTFEKKRRLKHEAIAHDYLDMSGDIATLKISPTRIINKLAEKFDMSHTGIRNILKEYNVYLSAANPVVIPDWYLNEKQSQAAIVPVQTEINFQ